MPTTRGSHRALLILVAAAGLAPLSGCFVAAAGAAAGYGGYEYANGDTTGVASATLDRTWRATLAAIDQLNLNVRSKEKDGTSASFKCTTEDGTTDVDITLARRSGDMTAIVVRYGLFGDDAKSRPIIAKIKASL